MYYWCGFLRGMGEMIVCVNKSSVTGLSSWEMERCIIEFRWSSFISKLLINYIYFFNISLAF